MQIFLPENEDLLGKSKQCFPVSWEVASFMPHRSELSERKRGTIQLAVGYYATHGWLLSNFGAASCPCFILLGEYIPMTVFGARLPTFPLMHF